MIRFTILAVAALSSPLSAREIQGGVGHDQQIALSPDAVLVVELHGRDGIVAEASIPADGRRAPLPFRLTDVPGDAVLFRAAIRENGAASWVTDVYEIEAGDRNIDLRILPLQPHPAAGVITTFTCGSRFVTAGYAQDAAVVSMGGEGRRLLPVKTASGAKYSDGAGNETSFWSKGRGATVVWSGVALPECAPVATPEQALVTARGNEPGWRLDMDPASGLRLTTELGLTVEAGAVPPAIVRADALTYIVPGVLVADLLPLPCTDSMSGMTYPLTAAARTLDPRSETLLGCAGNPLDLVQGDWTVISVSDADVAEGTEITLTFEGDRVTGRGGCNRYSATVELTGEALRFGPAAATRMGCAPDIMAVEAAFFEALAAVDRFDMAPNGALLLIAADRPRIVATR